MRYLLLRRSWTSTAAENPAEVSVMSASDEGIIANGTDAMLFTSLGQGSSY
jgi:hypothetical protein